MRRLFRRIELGAAFAVRDDDRHAAAGHAGKKQGGRFDDFGHDQARLELLDRIALKTRPVRRAGNQPFQRAHHLAAVADAQGKGIAAREESGELVARARVEENRARPAFARPQHVAIGKTAARRRPFKVGQRDAAGEDVAHMHIDGGKTCPVEGRRHFGLAVDALLAQDRDPRPRASGNERRGDVFRRIVGQRHRQPRIVLIENAVIRLPRAFRVVAQRLHVEAGFRPGALQVDTLLAQHRLTPAGDTQLAAAIGRAEQHGRNTRRLEHRLHGIAHGAANLDHRAQFFGKQRANAACGRTVAQIADIDAHAAVRGEGHFSQAGEQPAVGTVMIGQQHSVGGKALNQRKKSRQLFRRINVGRRRARGTESLRQRRTAQAVAAHAEVDQHQVARLAAGLQLRRQRMPRVRHRRKGRNNQRQR